MNAKWLIVNVGKQESLNQLFYGIQEAGRQADVVSLKEFNDMMEVRDDGRACVVSVGSIWANTTLKRMRPNWVGNWHDETLFTCRRYYSFWGKHLTQRDYVMLPLSEVERRKEWVFDKVGIEDDVFIRPDSGAKDFTGTVVSRAQFDSWLNVVKEYNPADLLCVLAPPQSIDRELRLVVKDRKVVAGATYKIAKHMSQEPLSESDGMMDRVVEFTEMVLADNPPPLPPVHVIDIALQGDRLSILEVGCFCCAGLYCIDHRLIAKAVSEAAEEEFARVNQCQEDLRPS